MVWSVPSAVFPIIANAGRKIKAVLLLAAGALRIGFLVRDKYLPKIVPIIGDVQCIGYQDMVEGTEKKQ